MLSAKQLRNTSTELHQNHELSGLSLETIRSDLGFSQRELEAAFELTPGNSPTNVWKLRDYLERKVKEQGKNPVPFSALKVNIYYPY